VQEGQVAELVVDTDRLYFFDLETGLAIDGPTSTPADDDLVAAGPGGRRAGSPP
jgi:hypothetical protein